MSKENIFVIGFPRSGNTWVARLLGDVLNSPVKARSGKVAIADEGFDRPGKYIIRQEHSDPNQFTEQDKVVLVVRDPRDVIVSAMHYWKMKDIETATLCVIYGKWPTVQGSGWVRLYEWWLGEKTKIDYLIKYEDLYNNTEREVINMLDALGVISEKLIGDVVKRQSFSARKEYANMHPDRLSYNLDVQNRALRKGIVGDWTNYFDNGLLEKIKTANAHDISFAEIAQEYGYDVCSRS